MKELEKMGLSPIGTLFSENRSFETTEKCYQALTKAKAKYPKWYKEVSVLIDGLMVAA